MIDMYINDEQLAKLKQDTSGAIVWFNKALHAPDHHIGQYGSIRFFHVQG